MTLALKVTDSNCTIWPMASIKELQKLVLFLKNLFWDILKWIPPHTPLLWNKALFLPQKWLCRRNLVVLIEPEVIIVFFFFDL